MTRYAIGVGSNVGDRHRNLLEACAELERHLGELMVSGIYETEPVGGPDQDPYLNAVVVAEADLPPQQLLDVIQEIEKAHGRERTVEWGPRTLDLDIVASDGRPVSTSRLEVPHPRAIEREFVLRPLVDVWPEAPVSSDLEAKSALAVVGDQGVDLLSRRWIPQAPRWPALLLLGAQFTLILAVALALVYDGTIPDRGMNVAQAAGVVVAIVGAGLAFAASRRLGTALRASPLPRQDAALVTDGPYRYARHPIYGGLILFFVGTSLALDSVAGLIATMLLVPLFLLKAAYEERHLRMRYAGYLEYRRRVGRRLIPYLI